MFKTFKPVFVAASLCLAIVSCKKDVAEDYSNPAGEGMKTTAETVDASSYYPNANGSDYTYVDTTDAGSSRAASASVKVLGDTTIDEMTYSKTSTGGSKNLSYYNSTGGVTKLVAFNGKDKITSTVLKANEPVGTVWTDNFTNNGVPSTYEWKMVAKGLTRTVMGVTYKDVIQVHLLGTAQVAKQGKVVFADADYFYAPNVGLIENVAYNTVTGKTELHRVLQNHVK